jgi:hypothetical protein
LLLQVGVVLVGLVRVVTPLVEAVRVVFLRLLDMP